MKDSVMELSCRGPVGSDQYDVYPSRTGESARTIKRKDPVVYRSSRKSPPMDGALIDEYERQGFLVIEDVFSALEIEQFQQELERLRTSKDAAKTDGIVTELNDRDVCSVFCVHIHSPLFKSVAEDNRLTDIAEYILGDDVYIHQSRVNYKPGFRGEAHITFYFFTLLVLVGLSREWR